MCSRSALGWGDPSAGRGSLQYPGGLTTSGESVPRSIATSPDPIYLLSPSRRSRSPRACIPAAVTGSARTPHRSVFVRTSRINPHPAPSASAFPHSQRQYLRTLGVSVPALSASVSPHPQRQCSRTLIARSSDSLRGVPELPEVETVRRELDPVLTGNRITDVEARRPDLRMPFPPRFRSRLRGQTVAALTRRAKYLLAELSSGETLLMHLGMSGSFRIELPGGTRPSVDLHDHVVFDLDSGVRVLFNDPRRFGFMDLLTASERQEHPVLSRLGPEPLSRGFRRRCTGPRLPRQEDALSRSPFSISASSPASATSTRARRCTSRGCRRGGGRAFLRPRPARRARPPTGWPPRSSKS